MRRATWSILGLAVAALVAVVWHHHRPAQAPASASSSSGLTSPATESTGSTLAATDFAPSSSAIQRSASEALRAREARAEAFGAFDSWAAAWLAQTDEAARQASLPAGLAAAADRRAALHDLIADDPQQALQHAVPWAVRRALPPAVAALLEARVDGLGRYDALAALAPAAGTPAGPEFRAALRQVELDGRTYETFTYGRRLQLGSRPRLAIHGIAIDGRLALLDSAIRVLDPGEPVPAGRRVEEVCAVSGQATTRASAAAAVVDTGDRVIYLCSAGHISILASQLESAEGSVLAADGSSGSDDHDHHDSGAASGAVTGTRRVLMIRVRFADQPSWFEPETRAAAEGLFATADAFYRENSFGALHIAGTVTPVYTLPQTASWYSSTDTSGYALNVLKAARAVAADPASAPGNDDLPAFDYLDFDFEAVRYTTGPGVFSGQGFVATRGCWIKSSEPGVLIHELGHNLGLWHANAWSPADPLAPLGSGTNVEYGDALDTMGPARGGAWHFNTWEKHRLGWLADTFVAAPAGSAQVAHAAHDLGRSDTLGRLHALRIRRDDDRDYWVELRRHPGWLASRPDVRQGLGLRWDPWSRSNGGTQLIDTTPGSPASRDDATLAIGRTFADPAAGIYITPLGVDPGDADSILVDVRIGDFAGNRAPVASAAASSAQVAIGQSVQFSAQATDPDGDDLSFVWSFDGTEATSPGPLASHAWAAEGDHRARLTVSDRRGGTASVAVLVRVGTPPGSRISGRVVDLDGNPVPDALVSNISEPGADGYRSAWSDADGSFTLLDVPAGTWHLAARAPGWLFALEGFDRAVSTPADTEQDAVTILGLWKGFSITGTVRRADGSPVPGATVRTGTRAEPTDRWGEFKLTGLVPGRHTLTVAAGDAAFEAMTVEVGLADITSLYITERTYSVSGIITGAASDTVTVTTGWQSTTVESADAPQRRFTLAGVPAGTWALRAVAPNETFSPQGFAEPLAVAADLSGIALAGDAVPRLAVGGVVTDRGVGLPGVTVSSGAVSTLTDSRGAYWLGGLAPGICEIQVAAPGHAFVVNSRTVQLDSTPVYGVDFSTDRENAAPVLEAPQVVGARNQPFVTLAAAAADADDGPGALRYLWSVTGDAPGEVDFSCNAANAAQQTSARFSAPGTYLLRVTAVDSLGARHSRELSLTVEGGLPPPVIISAARATPAIVSGDLRTHLSVLGSTAAGDARLSYTWSVLPADGGSGWSAIAGPVSFSANACEAARETDASFQRAGNYLLRVIVRDPRGQTAESTVSVRVEHTYQSWLGAHFAPGTLAAESLRASTWGDLADPDGDGTVNLLEYAFGGDPLVAAADARPATNFVTDDGIEYLAVTFRPNPDAIDLIYEPEVSGDLETWQGGLVFVPGPDDRTVTYRDFAPTSEHDRRFIRVNVHRNSPDR